MAKVVSTRIELSTPQRTAEPGPFALGADRGQIEPGDEGRRPPEVLRPRLSPFRHTDHEGGRGRLGRDKSSEVQPRKVKQQLTFLFLSIT